MNRFHAKSEIRWSIATAVLTHSLFLGIALGYSIVRMPIPLPNLHLITLVSERSVSSTGTKSQAVLLPPPVVAKTDETRPTSPQNQIIDELLSPVTPIQQTDQAGTVQDVTVRLAQPDREEDGQRGTGAIESSGAKFGLGESDVVGPFFDADYLNNPAPRYPPIARKLNLQGTVVVRVLVDPEGKPAVVRLEKSAGSSVLDQTALNTVQGWLFVPARQGDQPKSAWVDVPILFRIQ